MVYGMKTGGAKGGRILRNSVAYRIATVWGMQVGGGQ